MKSMKKNLLLPMIAVVLLLGWGCYPGTVSVSELDTVLTLYDEEEDFSRFMTYAMPDTIVLIGDDEDNETDDRFDQDILNRVAQNMEAKGYTRVDSPDQADIVMLVEKSRSDLLVGWNPCPGCWCGYWCWWYGPGWNPWYPWYGGGTVVYSYPLGTIFMTMFDNIESEDQQADANWSGTFNGLVQGSDGSILARIERAVDQAFEQSPYLGR